MKWLLASAMLLALPAMAKEGDTFRPFVSLGYFYDSNLFRLDENESPGTQRDDRYALLSAGANVDWKPGRQQVVANLTKTLIRYDNNAYLDFDGDDMQATWNWRLGNRLSGNLGAAKSTSQSSFGDIGLANNQVDRERRFGRAEWEFHPRWRIGGGLETTDNTNSDPSQLSQNVQQQVQDVVLKYLTPKGSNLRAQVRRIDADFPNQQTLGFTVEPVPPFFFTVVADNSFKQTEYNLLGDWRLSGKLTLRGQAGWVDRQYKNELKDDLGGAALLNERPDFSGFTGRLSADWFATGKTLLSVSAYREPGGATDINASSVLRTGASVNGVWLMREKWRLNLGATYENRDFKGDPGATQPQRNDDTLGSSLSLSYTPHPVVAIDLGLRAGSRDSNITGEDYSFHSLFATVRADF
ncbi:MAG: outer membrane beta-barrel protein [Thiobacillus sp.]|nr:outer membrane beta-barrel protein [Thiobacillus sp.]